MIAAWGEGATGYYLLSLWRDRVEFPRLKQAVVNMAAQWKPRWVLVEDAASGQSLIQKLKNSTALPIKPVKVDRDKVARASSVTPLLESGRVHLPSGAPWLVDFLNEHSSFDKGTHDDIVDTTTQALNFLRGRGLQELNFIPRNQRKRLRRLNGISTIAKTELAITDSPNAKVMNIATTSIVDTSPYVHVR